MNPYITLVKPTTANQTDIKFVTESTSANSKSTISGFTASDLSSNAAFVNVSFTNSENKVQRAAFFSTTLFIQIGTGNDSLPLVDKIDIWVKIINANVITTTANAATSNKFNVTAERIGEDILRLKSKVVGVNLTAASSLTDAPDNFAVELSDFAATGTSLKRYSDASYTYDNLSGVITGADSNGTAIVHAVGETLGVLKDVPGVGELRVLPSYTK